MFDIGLFEILVIGCVGLLVIGPDKLPGTIKTCALWIGRIKRSILETRREIEQQIGADEIRQQLRNEQVMESLEKLKETRDQLERDLLEQISQEELEDQRQDTETVHHGNEGDAINSSDTDTNEHAVDGTDDDMLANVIDMAKDSDESVDVSASSDVTENTPDNHADTQQTTSKPSNHG